MIGVDLEVSETVKFTRREGEVQSGEEWRGRGYLGGVETVTGNVHLQVCRVHFKVDSRR